jgi:hypothetical protein
MERKNANNDTRFSCRHTNATSKSFYRDSAALPDQIHPIARRGYQLAALLCAGLLPGAVWAYPLGGYWLGAGLLAYLAVLLKWRHAWLVLVPAALPVLDLSPWTGRFYLDEFDCLLAATVALNGWRLAASGRPLRLPRAASVVCALFGLSCMVSILIGAYPFPAPDLNSFNNYYSPYNALRMGKGLAWTVLLWPLFKDELSRYVVSTQRRFALGMVLGVAAATLGVLWERAAFTGLFNFSSGYRVVGLFSAMHIGGAYIEAYFATALPLVGWWTLTSRSWPKRIAGAGVFGAGGYALVVTYARAGYLALALGMAVLVLGLWVRNRQSLRPRHPWRSLLLLSLLALVAWPVLQGDAMQRRYATIQRDWQLRTAHWADALRIMDTSRATRLFGMGMGSYPASYLAGSSEGIHPSSHALAVEQGNTYLLLSAGAPLYVEQFVRLQDSQRYRLSFWARSRSGAAELGLPICEKWMLYSAQCLWQSVRIADTGGRWQQFSLDFDSGVRARSAWSMRRSTKLSVFNPASDTTVEIDKISLRASEGRELLGNGDFSEGLDRWFFASDNYLPWHLENTWLQLYFEQGGFGVLAFAALLIVSALLLRQRQRDRDLYAPALAASLTAFLTLCMVNSLFDFPHMSLLFFLLIAQSLFDSKRTMQAVTWPLSKAVPRRVHFVR